MVNKDKNFVGKKIKERRKMLKMTQFELAEAVGMHEKQISRIEAGLNNPTFDNFIKITEVLNMKLGDFDETKKDSFIRLEIRELLEKSTQKELAVYLKILKVLKN